MTEPFAIATIVAAANLLGVVLYYAVMLIVAWRSPDALAHMGPLHPMRRIRGCGHAPPRSL